tara:strand:+ start:342 stop:617 length:276 start_codon:yes stop_codon:yes gene_type:complete
MSALNTFDFYSITVSSKTKSPLLKAGVEKHLISKHRTGWKTYGYGWSAKTYPVWGYEATVGYTEVNGNPDSVAKVWRDKGLTTHVRYHAVD